MRRLLTDRARDAIAVVIVLAVVAVIGGGLILARLWIAGMFDALR